MRRIKLFFCVIITVALFIPQNVYAREADAMIDDSRTISAEIREQLMCNEDDEIIRVLNLSFINSFREHGNIRDVITDPTSRIQTIYRITAADGTVTYKTIYNGQSYKMAEHVHVNENALSVFYLSDQIIRNVFPDIIINHVYLLWAETYFEGTAIYYETDQGDFVYYFSNWYRRDYFFPVETFCAVVKALDDEGWNGKLDMADFLDLSKFEIHSDTFDPTATITLPSENDTVLLIAASCGAILLIAAVVFGGLRWYRRKA